MKPTTLLLIFIGGFATSCRCPQFLQPKISANTLTPDIGLKLILTVPHINKANVFWQGPTGKHVGESWSIDSLTYSNSGNYGVYYMYKNRKKCVSDVSSVTVSVKNCPELPKPEIYLTSTFKANGDRLVLSVKSIDNVNVIWSTPSGTFTANPLILENSTAKDSGIYSVKYVHKTIKNCQSVEVFRKIKVYPNIQTLNFKGNNYFVDYVVNEKRGEVWLRQNKNSEPSPADIKLMAWSLKKMTKEDFSKQYCNNVNTLSKLGTTVACLKVAGAAGCILGAAETGGLLLPVCEVLILDSEPAAIDCVTGLAGQIAEITHDDIAANVADLGVAISGRNVESQVIAALQFSCLTAKGDVPVIVGGDRISTAREEAAQKAKAEAAKNESERKSAAGSTSPTQGKSEPSYKTSIKVSLPGKQ